MHAEIVDNHGLDLGSLEWADAVREARDRCAKTNAEIAREFSAILGLKKPYPMSTVQRWFNSNDRKYWPSAEYVPTLCRVLGNFILVAWMLEQSKKDSEDQVITKEDLLVYLPAILTEMGRVGEALALVSQEGLTLKTSRGVRGALTALMGRLSALRRLFAPLARRHRRQVCAH